MKKIVSLILVLALCCAILCGCGAKQEQPSAGLANPVKDYASLEEQTLAMGFGLEAPEGASDVRYQSIEDMVQTVFTLNGVEYCYRAQPTGEFSAYDMSGLYYTFNESVSDTVLDREATAFICDQAGFVQWLDVVPGINYNLGANSKVSADTLLELANLIFVPVQGEADGDEETADADYAGTFINGDPAEGCETIIFTLLEDGTYAVDLSIFRLSQFPGTGSIMDGAVEMVLTDPNDGEMCAIFFPAEDGSFTLRITQSTWSLLPEGEEFTGFARAE